MEALREVGSIRDTNVAARRELERKLKESKDAIGLSLLTYQGGDYNS